MNINVWLWRLEPLLIGVQILDPASSIDSCRFDALHDRVVKVMYLGKGPKNRRILKQAGGNLVSCRDMKLFKLHEVYIHCLVRIFVALT